MDYFKELENKNNDEYFDLANLIVSKSKFNVDKLGEYVANFLTLFYGEKFIYVIGRCNVNDRNMVYKYVARRKDKVEYLNIETVNKIYKDEEIAILDISKNGKNNITEIYTLEDDMLYENGKLTPIVKEFINNLIEIKINGGVCNLNSVTDVSYKLLTKYYKQVKENYNLLFESKKEKLLNELNHQFQEKYYELNLILKREKDNK